jgi:hypothetical protein
VPTFHNAGVKTKSKIIITLGAVIGAIVLVCCEPPSPKIQPEFAEERDDVDRILKGLKSGNFAFNVPTTMNLRDTALIQVLLSLETSIDDLKQKIEAAGEKQGARIQVSNRMEARLSGSNFDITAVTPETQAVSQTQITEWKWEVKPRSTGHQQLHLTLSVLLDIDGTSTPKPFDAFDKVIDVEVTWNQQARSFLEKNWQWLWAAVLVPIAGWLWRRKKASKP